MMDPEPAQPLALKVALYQIMSESAKPKVTVTKKKTALKQETYNLSDLKHDLHCGFVELESIFTD